ncbi:DUF3274 domain-containing protein [Burkholderia sp. Ac-20344]|uniref:T6SS effector phospholipase Tle3 domain-containing protein n=1 Tax=Burkholderia sp. Ac-20344 TaxID=2703890 RepID=UPI001F11CE60|nr:DUF3274 domain-containing protein [Burkholderia sp. Ac-20344]
MKKFDNSSPIFIAESLCVPGDANVTLVSVPRPMPCIVVFVHGVNSEGEWYGSAESALIKGLNERLGRADLVSNACKYGDDVRVDRRPFKSLDLKNSPIYEELHQDKPKWVREDAQLYDGSNQVRYRRQIPEEITEEFKSTIATPTNHSTILRYGDGMLVERVLAYDLPIGRADSFSDRPFWKKLLKMADWLEEDPEYEQGGDYQFAGEPPPGVDCETNGMANERSIYQGS